MNLFFDINHPSYVHAFKNVLSNLQKKGHTVIVTAAGKDITLALLNEFAIPYTSTGSSYNSLLPNVFQAFKKIFILIKVIRRNNIQLVISFESPYAVIAGSICRKKTITFADTETAGFIHKITGSLSSTIVVPSCFQKSLSIQQLSFNGYKELAYLHPSNFLPDKKICEEYGIETDKPYAIIRFVSFNALHDKGFKGFSNGNRIKLVRALSGKMNVYISSESALIPELQPCLLKTPAGIIHHILAFASLYIGDSTTMAAEAAVLGVPSVCVNHMDLGYLKELSETYGLIFKFNLSAEGQNNAIEKAMEITDNQKIREEYQLKKEKMMADKIDVAAFMVWFVENYTGSVEGGEWEMVRGEFER